MNNQNKKKDPTGLGTHRPESIEMIIKNGEARNYLNSTGKSMIDELKEFTANSVDFFNLVNEKIAFDFQSYLKFASDHKKKIDSMSTDPVERMRKMEILKSLRERLFSFGEMMG